MSIDNQTIDKDNVKIKDTNVGKRAYFIIPYCEPSQVFTFSSTLEGIGRNNDCDLKNHSEVTIISDEQLGIHPIVGSILVMRVLAHEIMWVPSNSLVIIDDK